MKIIIPMGILLEKSKQFHDGFVHACLRLGTVTDGCLHIESSDYDKAKIDPVSPIKSVQITSQCCGGKPK